MIDKTCPILYDRDTNFIQAMSVPAPAGENREPGERPGRSGHCIRGARCRCHCMSAHMRRRVEHGSVSQETCL